MLRRKWRRLLKKYFHFLLDFLNGKFKPTKYIQNTSDKAVATYSKEGTRPL